MMSESGENILTGGGAGGGGEEMVRTTSGGVKIGKQIIEFGDFPEKIDVDVVRERAWRRLMEKERAERAERERREDRKRASALADEGL